MARNTRSRLPNPPKKNTISYVLPFLIIIGLGILLTLVYNFFFQKDEYQRQNNTAKAYIQIEKGSAEALVMGESKQKNIESGDFLQQGDQIITNADSIVILTFLDDSQSVIRLNENTEFVINNLDTKSSGQYLSVKINQGEAWFTLTSENQNAIIETPKTIIDTAGGIFDTKVSNSAESFYTIDGQIDVNVQGKNNENGRIETLSKFLVKKSNQLILTSEKISLIQSGEITPPTEAQPREITPPIETEDGETTEVIEEVILPIFIEPLSSIFTNTDWYTFNFTEDKKIINIEAPEITELEIKIETENETTSVEDQNSETGTTNNIEEVITETVDTPEIETVSEEDIAFQITSPKNLTNFNTKNITIEGTASGASKVNINGEVADLKNNKWSYIATLAKEGTNEFEVIAYAKNDKKIGSSKLIIIRDTVPPSKPIITAPENNSKQENSKGFSILGTVTTDTNIVKVNDSARDITYALSAYKAGNTNWLYNAKPDFGNLVEGTNTYTVTAFDKAGNKSESAQLVINYQTTPTTETTEAIKPTVTPAEEKTTPEETSNEEDTDTTIESPTSTSEETTSTEEEVTKVSSEETKDKDTDMESSVTETEVATPEITELNAPAITIPTKETSYKTPLDEIAIGGTADQNSAKIFVNGNAVGYVGGSTRWSTMIELQVGVNTFEVYAESKNGIKSPSAKISIEVE